MNDSENIICPHCKRRHSKYKILGSSGLINHSGYESIYVCCEKCGKDFYCDIEVKLKIKTRKNY